MIEAFGINSITMTALAVGFVIGIIIRIFIK
jgi:hypothetical protein